MTLPEIGERVFRDAVLAFWDKRTAQADKQKLSGVADQGNRGAVTGGQQMAGFALKLAELALKAGASQEDIHVTRQKSFLPGFFRPTKAWDLLVVRDSIVIAAIELKSHVGSFGNNFNNRTEEALGTAVDIWTAFREGAMQTAPAPWVGYLLLLEDSPKSRRPVRVNEPHLPVLTEFKNASYAQRYEFYCRKLILERQYSSACLLMSNQENARQHDNYSEPASDLSAKAFLSQFTAHIAAATAHRG